jgi:hypothetical protein
MKSMDNQEKIIMLEKQLKQAFENLDKAESRLNWLERFLQGGGTSISSVPYYTIEDHPDDTEETRYNLPFQIGMLVEKEHRGCYEWVEFSNGAKGIRPAIDAAKVKYNEWWEKLF